MSTQKEFYPTPPEVTRALLSVEAFDGLIWEPCAGRGDMAQVLRGAGHFVIATTIESDHEVMTEVLGGKDFFDIKSMLGPSNIVTNPPYSRTEEFLRHAFSLGLKGKVALFLNIKFLASQSRKQFFADHPPSRVWVFRDRITMYPGDWTGPRGSSTETTAWFVWDAPFGPCETKLGWITAKDFATP